MHKQIKTNHNKGESIMTTQSIAYTHTTTHNSTRNVAYLPANKGEGEYVSCSYESEQSFKDHLMYAMQQQGTVFAAVAMAKEINKLNGYKAVSDYEIVKIKSRFSNTYINQNNKNQNTENENGNIKSEESERREKRKANNDKGMELRKAYMKLLSV